MRRINRNLGPIKCPDEQDVQMSFKRGSTLISALWEIADIFRLWHQKKLLSCKGAKSTRTLHLSHCQQGPRHINLMVRGTSTRTLHCQQGPRHTKLIAAMEMYTDVHVYGCIWMCRENNYYQFFPCGAKKRSGNETSPHLHFDLIINNDLSAYRRISWPDKMVDEIQPQFQTPYPKGEGVWNWGQLWKCGVTLCR